MPNFYYIALTSNDNKNPLATNLVTRGYGRKTPPRGRVLQLFNRDRFRRITVFYI